MSEFQCWLSLWLRLRSGVLFAWWVQKCILSLYIFTRCLYFDSLCGEESKYTTTLKKKKKKTQQQQQLNKQQVVGRVLAFVAKVVRESRSLSKNEKCTCYVNINGTRGVQAGDHWQTNLLFFFFLIHPFIKMVYKVSVLVSKLAYQY